MPNLSTRKPLSSEEKKKLYLAVEELKARGVDIPPEVAKFLEDKKRAVWPVDPNGYFVKSNGKRYSPSEQQKKFVESTARFSALWGPARLWEVWRGRAEGVEENHVGRIGGNHEP